MATIVGGFACSHAPSIAHAYDRNLCCEVGWKPLFRALDRARQWLAGLHPDVLVMFYNDHIDQYFLDSWPTFGIGIGDSFAIADEGWLPRALAPVPGHPALARYLASELVARGFDLTVAHQQVVDHGVLSPLPLIEPTWTVPIIPIAINVVFPPLPTPARCWQLGKAVGEAIEAYGGPERVIVVGTGGLSHQLTGPDFGVVHAEWDREFLRRVEEAPESLAELTMDELARLGGDHSIEVVQWIAMRAALLGEGEPEVRFYYAHDLMGYGVLAITTENRPRPGAEPSVGRVGR